MKRWIFSVALCLCVCLLVGGLVGRAEAADIVASGGCGTNLTWTLDSEGTLTISGSGNMYDYDYTGHFGKLAPWKSQSDSIHAIVIEQGVTSIGSYAFYGCSSLTSITIPDSVASIGNSAFRSCSGLTSITIPDGVTSIGSYAFHNCRSLTSITIPDNVTSIGSDAFYGCSNLTGIWVGEGNLNYFSDEKGVLYNKEKTKLMQCPGGLSGTYAIPDSVTRIGNSAFSGCSSLTSITIPDGVTSIGSDAFYGCSSLTSITIPDSVARIGDYAFYGCSSLTSITIPDSVTRIGDYAFSGCSSLTGIWVGEGNLNYSSDEKGVLYSKKKTVLIQCPGGLSGTYAIPDSVTSIGDWAFSGCSSLTSITIPDSVTSIGDWAFHGCSSLASIFFNGDAPTIATDAFSGVNAFAFYPAENTTWGSKKHNYGGTLYWREMDPSKEIVASGICGENMMWQLSKDGVLSIKGSGTLTDFSLWESYQPMIQEVSFAAAIEVPTIPAGSFNGYRLLRTITLPDSVTSIGYGAFFGCSSLTSITIPNSVTSIEDDAFSCCSSLTSITIPDGVTSIEDRAFSGCSSLTSITIPDSVTSIGDSAFSDCSSLTGIWVGEGNLNYSSDEKGVLYSKKKTVLIQCPGGLSGTYAIPDSVTRIGNSAFSGCSNLTSITIPDSVASIGNSAFRSCSGLTSITIPDSVTRIGNYAFYDCRSLTSITIPDGVTSIGDSAFWYCSSLTSITIPDGVTSIGHWAFSGCSSLTSITIPDSVTSIGGSAFWYCSSLTSITIPDSVTSIGGSAFWYCSSLTSITIPDGVTSIGDSAFSGCSSLTNVTIPDSVTSIGDSAFSYCSSLTSITIPERVASIEKKAFMGCNSLKVVVFQGGKPSIGLDAFSGVIAVTYYPESLDSDSSWKENGALIGYGGALTWKPWYTLGNDPLCEHILEDTIVPPSCTWGYTLHKCACGYSYRTDFEVGTGHDMVTDAAVPATCTETGLTEGSHCSRCDYKIAQEVTPKLGHDFIDHEAKAATCTEIGWEAYQTCSRCDYTTYKELPAKGHTPAAAVRENEVAATCTKDGSYDEVVYCSVCNAELSRKAKKLDALGHDFIDHEAKAASCTEIGWEAYQTCSRCDYTSYKEIPALGHDYVDHEAKAATCTEIGWEAYQTCSRCDYTTYKELPAKGHTPAAAVRENEVAATCTESGSYDEVVYCSVCKAELSRSSKKLDALGHNWGEAQYAWSSDHAVITATQVCKNDANHTESELGTVSSKVTKEATYEAEGEITYTATFTNAAFATQTAVVKTPRLERPAPTPADNPFTDVKTGNYYYDAVLWAVEQGVTAGTSATNFSPDDGCTRAQVVTFLWRAAGQPEPTSSTNPFTDVAADTYYYKAVLWAVEHNVTAGTSATTFSPDDTCTRAQIVTFLWRYEGQPTPVSAEKPFTDVQLSAYFGKAVLWAVENGITNGTSATTFSPETTCTRAQVVTFLYRDIKK